MLYLDAVTSVSSSEVKKEVSNSKQQSLVPKTELYVVVVTCYLLLVVLQEHSKLLNEHYLLRPRSQRIPIVAVQRLLASSNTSQTSNQDGLKVVIFI